MDSVTEWFRQFTLIGGLLAGFAITFLVGLLNAPQKGRALDCAVGAALVSAACLIATTVISFAAVVYITDRTGLGPGKDIPDSIKSIVPGAAKWAGLSFGLGMIALLLNVGFCGWIRSRRLGLVSSILAGVTLLMIVAFLRFVVQIL